jgi:hypothetical protein
MKLIDNNKQGLFSTDHYDSKGHRTGKSHPGWFGSTETEFNKKK